MARLKTNLPLVSGAALQASARIAALCLAILLARVLGARDYGIYAYAVAIMSVLLVFAEAGAPTLLMREAAAGTERASWNRLRGALVRARTFVLASSTAICLFGLATIWQLGERLTATESRTAALMLLVLPMAALSKTAAHALRGIDRNLTGQLVEILLRPVLLLLFLAVVFSAIPDWRLPETAMAGQLVAALITLLVATLAFRTQMPTGLRSAVAEYPSRQWLTNARPFVLMGGAGIINGQADVIMLGWFKPLDEVGAYRAAVQLAVVVGFGLQVLSALAAPNFAKLHARSDAVALQKLVTRTARLSLTAAVPAAAVLTLAGGLVLGWVFGDEFSSAHLPLAVLAFGQLINAGLGAVGFLLTMTGHERETARVLWQTTALNVAMNLVLIPLYGALGAAVASTASLAIWNLVLARLVWRHLGLNATAFPIQGRP